MGITKEMLPGWDAWHQLKGLTDWPKELIGLLFSQDWTPVSGMCLVLAAKCHRVRAWCVYPAVTKSSDVLAFFLEGVCPPMFCFAALLHKRTLCTQHTISSAHKNKHNSSATKAIGGSFTPLALQHIPIFFFFFSLLHFWHVALTCCLILVWQTNKGCECCGIILLITI